MKCYSMLSLRNLILYNSLRFFVVEGVIKVHGLKISVIEGETLSGDTEFFFDSSHDYIVLGTDTDMCHVTFVEHLKEHGVGNEHIAFKRSLGRYQLDLHTELYVQVDGEPPFEDLEIKDSCEILLGKGVKLQVSVLDQRTPAKSVGKPLLQAGTLATRNRKLLWLSMLSIVAVFVALLYVGRDLISVRDTVFDVSHDVSLAVNNAEGLLEKIQGIEGSFQDVSQSVIDRVTQSVYLVLVKDASGGETPAGTAWVTENNALATNAHVADIFNEIGRHDRLVVRSSVAPYKTFTVKEIVSHPGFLQYQALWQNYLPVQRIAGSLELMETVLPADVALLKIEGEESVGEPLPLASLDDLALLAPGMKVAYVGFPSEQLLPGSWQAPAPVAHQDEIVRITDFFMVKQADNVNRLIQHGLPIAGGASGSPMFNAQGEVIGLVSAGNALPSLTGRLMNSVDINFSQRVDYLFDLLPYLQNESKPKADLDKLMQGYIAQWQTGLSQFGSAQTLSHEAVKQHVQSAFSLQGTSNYKMIRDQYDEASSSNTQEVVDVKTLELPYAGVHLVTLSSQVDPMSFTVDFPLDKHVSALSYPIPYSKYVKYQIIMTNEPVSVDVNMGFYAMQDETMRDYTLELNSWEAPVIETSMAFVQQWLKHSLNVDEELMLVYQSEDLEAIPSENPTEYTDSAHDKASIYQNLAGFDLTLTQAGWYIFLAVPQGDGRVVDTWLADDYENVLATDNSDNAIALMMYEHSSDEDLAVTFASTFEHKDTLQNMYVYYVDQR